MARRLPTLVPRDAQERSVIDVWRSSGLQEKSIAIYLVWVRRYRAYCAARAVNANDRLTQVDAFSYMKSYIGERRGRRVKKSTRLGARNALHAWWAAWCFLGNTVPPWRRPLPEAKHRSRLVREYLEYRRVHRGVAAATLVRDAHVSADFVRFLRSRRRDVAASRVKDIDAFIDSLSERLARRTVAHLCSSLRCFLKFLHATGCLSRDLARCVVAPRFRFDEHLPRALPWDSVRRILREIPRNRPTGRRDYAMFLLMATYGMGAGEVVHLRLSDIDWRAGVIRSVRAKTAVPLELPLLAAVAKALAAYLRRGRPRYAPVREIFVTRALPHRALTTSVLRHQVRQYARRAGVEAPRMGSHIFRHSHATRQIDAGANPTVVSEILGHRRPSSTSVYVKLALHRLRAVALPVPR